MEQMTNELYQQARERLAEKEHDQWMRWAKNLLPELKQLTQLHLPYGDVREAGNCHCKTCERIKRWEKLFIPYSELTEEQKDQDRVEADQILSQTWDNGLPMFGVLDPEQELPPIYWNEAYPDITERVQRDMLNDNWRKVVEK